ncbi:cubilin [Trichonephila clavipes]|uniref:Cubilin n=1 Tax=Trichonephila clavipes TaxID=2585209 RepID=A0A8X6SXN9_TRICX|nr:cubilin [Trichonephila clavipes]
MAQRKHLDDFLRGRIIERLECGRTQQEVSEELGSDQSVISRIWQRFQDDGNVRRCYSTGRPGLQHRMRTGIWQLKPKETDEAQHQTCLVSSLQLPVPVTTKKTPLNDTVTVVQDGSFWGGIIIGSRTDLHVQSVTMTGHIYWAVILEQHVRLFRGTMGAEFLFMDDNARPHRANFVDECLQS